ncbi:orotidine-5'-phosphate decarboxylase, partial [bacterium]|nr:orotidine-5'-phosphate decarboxylase [bacterium]
MVSFGDRLMNAVRAKRTPVMLGIDPRWDQLPLELRERHPDPPALPQIASGYLSFVQGVIDTLADIVPVVKFQAAFFEAAGMSGTAALDYGLRYAASKGLVVVLDAKRGDIGSTAEAYAEAYIDTERGDDRAWAADALTVNPFLGRETLEPFVRAAR